MSCLFRLPLRYFLLLTASGCTFKFLSRATAHSNRLPYECKEDEFLDLVPLSYDSTILITLSLNNISPCAMSYLILAVARSVLAIVALNTSGYKLMWEQSTKEIIVLKVGQQCSQWNIRNVVPQMDSNVGAERRPIHPSCQQNLAQLHRCARMQCRAQGGPSTNLENKTGAWIKGIIFSGIFHSL